MCVYVMRTYCDTGILAFTFQANRLTVKCRANVEFMSCLVTHGSDYSPVSLPSNLQLSCCYLFYFNLALVDE